MKEKAILLINLGTPDSTEPNDVGKYLTEFLTDKHVIDIPYIFRQILVRALIVPKRKFASAKKYESVWMKEGSPLLHYTQSLTQKLDEKVKEADVFFAMRYGNPSIKSVMSELTQYKSIIVLPLYPQDTKSSYLTAVEEVKNQGKSLDLLDKLVFIPPFYSEDFYIDSWVKKISEVKADYYLFSYHGIPQHHLPKSCEGCASPCDQQVKESDCYRAQCYETTRLIAERLGLKPDQYRTSFQSRLGNRPWIKPYTDLVIEEIREEGIKNLAVFSPSFIVDCLETLEELGMELKEDFEKDFDELNLEFIPCLNDEDHFVNRLENFLSR